MFSDKKKLVSALAFILMFEVSIAGEVFSGSLVDSASNGNEASVATNVEDICPKLGAEGGFGLTGNRGDLFDRCNGAIRTSSPIFGNDPASAAVALDQIAAEERTAQESAVEGVVQRQTKNIAARISVLGNRTGSAALASFGEPDPNKRVMYASNDTQVATDGTSITVENTLGWGAFLTTSYNFGERDETDREAGYDFDDISATAGVDYFILHNLVAGIAIGYGKTDIDFDDNGGKMDADTLSVGVYSLWSVTDAIGLSGYLNYGSVDYDSERNLVYSDFNGDVNRTAQGGTDAYQFEATGNVWYNMSSGSWSYGPTGWISYFYTDIDGFEESGAQGLNMRYDDQDADSLQTALGGDVSYTISTEKGIAVLYSRAHWIHEFLNDSRDLDMKYVEDDFADSPTITVRTDNPDRDWAQFAVGGSFVFPGGISTFADFQTVLFKEDVESYTVTAGLRMEF